MNKITDTARAMNDNIASYFSLIFNILYLEMLKNMINNIIDNTSYSFALDSFDIIISPNKFFYKFLINHLFCLLYHKVIFYIISYETYGS